MGDAADILGLKKEKKVEGFVSAISDSKRPVKKKKDPAHPPNVSREVFKLLAGQQPVQGPGAMPPPPNPHLPSMIPTTRGFQSRRGGGQKWEWTAYTNSARSSYSGSDGDQRLYRWHKVGIDFMDYPYARFNTKMEKVEFTDAEYEDFGLGDPAWTRAETDLLLELAHRYDLRWPVVYDRWQQQQRGEGGAGKTEEESAGSRASSGGSSGTDKSSTELQHRYLTLTQKLLRERQRRVEAQQLLSGGAAAVGSSASSLPSSSLAAGVDGSSSSSGSSGSGGNGSSSSLEAKALGMGVDLGAEYCLEHEVQRRAAVEKQWTRTRDEEKSEAQVKEELKQIEAELRRLHKTIASSKAQPPSKKGASSSSSSSSSSLAAGGPSLSFQAGGGSSGGGGGAVSAQSAAEALAVSAPARTLVEAATAEAREVSFGLVATNAQDAADPSSSSSDGGGAARASLEKRPYRLSLRLEPPKEESVGKKRGLSATLLGKLDHALQELQVPPAPTPTPELVPGVSLMPTPTVCDLYDALRTDTLTLLSLRKFVAKAEAERDQLKQQLETGALGGAAAAASFAATAEGNSAVDHQQAAAPGLSSVAAEGPTPRAGPEKAKRRGAPGGPKKRARK